MDRSLAHYRIVEKLGEGGMGEVYRATDAKLGRDVAIKVLPERFGRDPERLARFEREARLLASLNHPNIAAIYGFEQSNDVTYLVLELVAGPTIAEIIANGPIPLNDALRISTQVAQALEAAHGKGIIHRDLKPGNVKVTPDGKVKILDFGLAKAFVEDSPAEISGSLTSTAHATRNGVIVGTVPYMSPEQARSKSLDNRTDIWSFGCLLYEMLAAHPAFPGDTASDVLVSVLEREPDWTALPAETPAKVRELVGRCLRKDANRRLHDIADARVLIEEELVEPSPPAPSASLAPRALRRPWSRVIPWALAALFAGAAIWSMTGSIRLPQPISRTLIGIPATDRLIAEIQPGLAISPDGSRIVYTALRDGKTQLFVRSLDQFDAMPIRGTEGAAGPFLSPDGEWVGFFAEGKLKKVSLGGGAERTICRASDSRGAVWLEDDTIVFNPESALGIGLWRVSAGGGTPQALTVPDATKGEASHRWPELLPGKKAVLFTIWTGGSIDASRVAVLHLDTRQWQVLLEGGAHARYLPTGHLVFARGGGLVAVPFDLSRLQLTGRRVPVLDGVLMDSQTRVAHYAVSGSGSLAYVPGRDRPAQQEMVQVDRMGAAVPATTTRRSFAFPVISPDGREVAVVITDNTSQDIWRLDLARDILKRVTLEGSFNSSPLWTPDGKRLAFRSNRFGSTNILWKPVEGSGPEERLTQSPNSQSPTAWSPNGKWLVYDEIDPATGFDVWLLPMEGERKPRPLARTPFTERHAGFSHNGQWLAYSSDETGRFEVYVQPFSPESATPGGRWQVSTEGGTEPVWAKKGPELYYRNGKQLMSVEISGPPFKAGNPKMLFEGSYSRSGGGYRNYDVTLDNAHFLMLKSSEVETAPQELRVVLNWFEELKTRVMVPPK